MKIAYIEVGVRGHNFVYLTNLIKGREEQSILIVPSAIDSIMCKQIVLTYTEGKDRNIKEYLQWLGEIYTILKAEKPDIVHFLSGDVFYRYFGLGLSKFRKFNTVFTMHWIRPGKLQKLSMQLIARHATAVVVHSVFLKKQLESYGIKNATHIEYPQFNQIKVDKQTACLYWGIDPNIKTLACIGSTRYDKGIDILIQALKLVKKPFQLLVAGQVNAFTVDDLKGMIDGIEDKVYLNIHYLSDDELAKAFSASDYVVLPYRRSFNGASGPLVEGVFCDKCIIGSNHGNLGYTICTHHLGYTFEAEDVDDLARSITLALSENFTRDEKYNVYKKSLNPDIFRDTYANLYKELLEREKNV